MSITKALIGMGMTSSLPRLERAGPPDVLSVLLDGCIIGSIASNRIEKAVSHLRLLKLSPFSGVCAFCPLCAHSFSNALKRFLPGGRFLMI